MITNPWLLGALFFVALAIYAYQTVSYRRTRQYAHIPQHKPSLLWGHLAVLAKYMKSHGRADINMDEIFEVMTKDIGSPELMLIDTRPLNYPIVCIRSHEVAEQVAKQTKAQPYSTPKSPTMNFLYPLIGIDSIIHLSGHKWKELRRRFNPGFAPQHLMSLMPLILEKTQPFLAKLDHYAKTGESFKLDTMCMGLTFDIIGAVTMGLDFGAQLPEAEQSHFMRIYQELLHTYANDDGSVLTITQPLNLWRRRRAAQRVDAYMEEFVRKQHEELKRQGSKNRSVLALSLQDQEHISQDVLRETVSQLKTFLFAGHDTTSILLQWAFYELSRTPRALKTLRAELDELFGPDPNPDVVRKVFLERGDEVMRKMSYTSAVIKETLRLYPPGGSGRFASPGSNLHIRLSDGSSFCADGLIMYICHTLIQRDEAVFGPTANDFVPERWLGNTDTWMTAEDDDADEGEKKAAAAAAKAASAEGDLPVSAWRAFERGPRNCIGQELANIEARVILACVVRKYDFVKVGLGAARLDEDGKPVLNERGQHVSDSAVYTTRQITARPNDGIMVKVNVNDGSASSP